MRHQKLDTCDLGLPLALGMLQTDWTARAWKRAHTAAQSGWTLRCDLGSRSAPDRARADPEQRSV